MNKKQKMIITIILSWVGLMLAFGISIEAESLATGWRVLAFLHGLGCIIPFLASAGYILSDWFEENKL